MLVLTAWGDTLSALNAVIVGGLLITKFIVLVAIFPAESLTYAFKVYVPALVGFHVAKLIAS